MWVREWVLDLVQVRAREVNQVWPRRGSWGGPRLVLDPEWGQEWWVQQWVLELVQVMALELNQVWALEWVLGWALEGVLGCSRSGSGCGSR